MVPTEVPPYFWTMSAIARVTPWLETLGPDPEIAEPRVVRSDDFDLPAVVAPKWRIYLYTIRGNRSAIFSPHSTRQTPSPREKFRYPDIFRFPDGPDPVDVDVGKRDRPACSVTIVKRSGSRSGRAGSRGAFPIPLAKEGLSAPSSPVSATTSPGEAPPPARGRSQGCQRASSI